MTFEINLRKIAAALILVAAFATVVGAVPGVLENVAYACDDPGCQ